MLANLPPDILDHIAFFAATHSIIGPPSDLLSLLTVSRSLHAALERSANPQLYARIFCAKFDVTALNRRYTQLQEEKGEGAWDGNLPAHVLAEELVIRCHAMSQLRSSRFARIEEPGQVISVPAEQDTGGELDRILLLSFVMTLENEGRNVAQLRQYAHITDWLALFWFDLRGSSKAMTLLYESNKWPLTVSWIDDERAKSREAFAMWLLWFYLDPESYVLNQELQKKALHLLKLVALNGGGYPLTKLAWSSFTPMTNQIHFGLTGQGPGEPVDPLHPTAPALMQSRAHAFVHYSALNVDVTPPALALPASLSLLAIQDRTRRRVNQNGGLPDIDDLDGDPFVALPLEQIHDGDASLRSPEDGLPVNCSSSLGKQTKPQDSRRWDQDWLRCIYAVDNNGRLISNHSLSSSSTCEYKAFAPGSFEGSWEGIFTYTEFTTFAQLLSESSPGALMNCLFARHNQTWRIKEYHFLDPNQTSGSDSNAEDSDTSKEDILPIGDALLAFVPEDVTFEEQGSHLHLQLPSAYNSRRITYTRYRETKTKEDRKAYAARVRDIILVGDGHSGWGEFRLVGRVRPVDGFVNFIKEYTGGDRGRWLYRGFLVGEGEGIDRPGGGEGFFAGRWRETMTPAESFGYEGAFAMGRREARF